MPQHWPIFSKHYSWLRVCTCNAELSCSTAFSTGYASRHSSSYKSLEQLFRVHLGSIVQQGLSALYTILVNFFQLYQSCKWGRIYHCRKFDYIFQSQSGVCGYLHEFSPSLSYWLNFQLRLDNLNFFNHV